MDTDFQIVGIRNTEDQTVSRHKKWYQGKPLISAAAACGHPVRLPVLSSDHDKRSRLYGSGTLQ